MVNKFILFIFLGGIIFSPLAVAAKDSYHFDSPQQFVRFQHLNQQFRCLVCQNKTLADSNMPLAKDLRYQIYKMIKQNQSDKSIVQFLTDRYDDFLIFRPVPSKLTITLWSLLSILLLLIAIRSAWLAYRWQRRPKQPTSYRFSKKDRERIRHLLQEY